MMSCEDLYCSFLAQCPSVSVAAKTIFVSNFLILEYSLHSHIEACSVELIVPYIIKILPARFAALEMRTNMLLCALLGCLCICGCVERLFIYTLCLLLNIAMSFPPVILLLYLPFFSIKCTHWFSGVLQNFGYFHAFFF